MNGIEITVIYTDRNGDERHLISAWRANPMNDDSSGTASKTEPATNWKRLRTMTDAEVHAGVVADPDIRPTDESFWKYARVVMPKRKETVNALDADLLAWFRAECGYQTRINAILRAYMNAHFQPSKAPPGP